MKPISKFVREQYRYTKNDLRALFSFDDAEVEKFIKNLKSFGILKSVENKKDQKDLTELVDDDVLISDETAGYDECLYVFTYVGVITSGNRILKVYPKYISADKEPLEQMKLVVKVMERYNNHEEQIINLFNGDDENRSFNMLSVILYLLNDYFSYGLYNNEQDILELNGDGDSLWGRTVDEIIPFIEDNKPYYTNIITHRTADDDTDYFRRLHEYILTECSQQLRDSQLDVLFDIETVDLSDEILDDFGDREYVLERIMKELNVQFNTHRQILLKTMYAYISHNRRINEEDSGISLFGTNAFHAVWEKACAEVFENRLKTEIGKIPMKSEIADGYNRKSKLIDLIDRPLWYSGSIGQYARETLEPDIITIAECNGTDCFIIFDAKYYLLRLDEKTLSGNPGVGDVVKQYMYQLAYKQFIKDHNISSVKNCFLMPTDKDEIICEESVRMKMLSELGLEEIKVRRIPADRLFKCYTSGKKIKVEELRI